MKIRFLTVSIPAIKELVKISKEINRDFHNILDLEIFNVTSTMTEKEKVLMEEKIKEGDFIFLDLMGVHPDIIGKIQISVEKHKGQIVPYGNSLREYMKLGSFELGSMKSDGPPNMKAMKKMSDISEKIGKVVPGKMRDMKNYSYMMKYFKNGDYKSIKDMIYLILREYGDYKQIPKYDDPRELPDVALCNPENMEYYKDFSEFIKKRGISNEKANIVLLYYGHKYPTDTSPIVTEVRNKLEEFANVYPIAISNTFLDEDNKLGKLLLKEIPYKIDLIINFMSFRLGAGPMGGDSKTVIEMLEKLNAVYMHPFVMSRRTIEDWRESVQGATTSEVMISVMLPELDGAIEIFPIAALGNGEYDSVYSIEMSGLIIIEERVNRLIEKCKGYIRLARKDNKDKRVAIIAYNYPPGESNIFGGAFLDTFESISKMTMELKKEGYNTRAFTAEGLKELFAAGRLLNSGKYGDYGPELIRYGHSDYKKDLADFRDYEQIIQTWGNSPGNIMTEGKDFLIPGIVDNNIFIGLQPSRGSGDDDKSYHDMNQAPHHQYLAYYKWLREEFKADAIIHVGTHGTLEFQKGKECGMSGECYPDILMGDVPHIYMYYCGNPSESTIAKRRSQANIVSYQPPIFIPGDLYGQYSKLMTLVDNYRQVRSISEHGHKEALEGIFSLAKELNLDQDLDLIETELYNMKSSLIPGGLHIIGEGYSDEESIIYGKGILRHSIGESKSLRGYIAEAEGLDLEQLSENNQYNKIEEIDGKADELFEEYIATNNIKKYEKTEELLKILEYGKKACLNSRKNEELQGMLRVLNGEYNPVKLSGDIYRSPNILPTGYGLYQFDPRLVPTRAAYTRGSKIAENTLEAFFKEEGKYPNSTAVILWGIETSRTQGESLSQILFYLGVRVKNTGMSWEPKYEIIPAKELKRPRIDVTINICGFFRDMFPNIIENLSDILKELFELDETSEKNHFKANSEKIYRYLLEEGYEQEEAKELAISRFFGPEEGQYGTGITDIIESKNWREETEIGTVFLDNLQYIYNRDKRGKKIENLYKENLKSVEIVSQIRSSNEYEITDLDHYYEFFGGLSKSVEIVTGKKAKMFITDVTKDKMVTDSVGKSIERGIRTRVLNPKWIDGLLKHDKHGVQEIAKRFENIMGLAATTGEVKPWIFDGLNEKYVKDEELRERLIKNNKYAYMDVLERLAEYYKRGYWNASSEDIDRIKDIFLRLENDIERDF